MEDLFSTAKNLFDDIEDESEDALLDACMDAELEAAGSPLMTVPTPNGERCPRERLSHASTFTNYSSSAGQHIAVIVRVRPPPIDEAVCVDWQEAASQIVVQPPVGAVEEQLAPTTPGGRMPVPPRTPGRTPGGNGGGRTPGIGRTPGGGMRPPAPKRFRFDAVCGPDSSQDEVFAQARPLIDAALGGASACVLAYGQTGSGKTYTMAGTPSAPGVVPRALERLFEAIDASPSTEWHVTMTFVELYNDGWRDLLAPSSQPNQRLLPAQAESVRREQSAIHLREVKSHVRGSPPAWRLEGSATFRTPVSSLAQLQELVAYGHRARAVGETRYNERSSRSHAVLSIHIDSKPFGATVVRTGKLLLVDLAGSEALTTGPDSVLTAETRAINVSLTALCNVLQALSRNARRAERGGTSSMAHVPFRDHKLTMMLADSLGGQSHTLMIAGVQTGAQFCTTTLTTLKFASRARDVTMLTDGAAGLCAEAEAVVGEGATAAAASAREAKALAARVHELSARLARREEEIERLGALHRAQLQLMANERCVEHTRHVEALSRASGAEQQAVAAAREQAARASLLELAEREYAISELEIDVLLAHEERRAAQLQLHRAELELTNLHRAADKYRSSLALVEAQRDASQLQSERDYTDFARAAEGWRKDREGLMSLRVEVEALRERVSSLTDETAGQAAQLATLTHVAAAGGHEVAELKIASDCLGLPRIASLIRWPRSR